MNEQLKDRLYVSEDKLLNLVYIYTKYYSTHVGDENDYGLTSCVTDPGLPEEALNVLEEITSQFPEKFGIWFTVFINDMVAIVGDEYTFDDIKKILTAMGFSIYKDEKDAEPNIN